MAHIQAHAPTLVGSVGVLGATVLVVLLGWGPQLPLERRPGSDDAPGASDARPGRPQDEEHAACA